MNELIANIGKLHTTPMGVERIRKNLGLSTDDVVEHCKQLILNPACLIERQGKNWYATFSGATVTVNAHSYTIITAHIVK